MKKLMQAVFALLFAAASVHAAEPAKDTRAAPPAVASKPAAQPAAKAPEAAPASAKIDLNSATEQELATLPGIGEARSKAIVKGRPYARKDELVAKKIIPASVYENIKERVVAHQAK